MTCKCGAKTILERTTHAKTPTGPKTFRYYRCSNCRSKIHSVERITTMRAPSRISLTKQNTSTECSYSNLPRDS